MDPEPPPDAKFLLTLWQYLIWAYPSLEETGDGRYRSPWFTASTPFDLAAMKSRFCELVGCDYYDLMVQSKRFNDRDYTVYQISTSPPS